MGSILVKSTEHELGQKYAIWESPQYSFNVQRGSSSYSNDRAFERIDSALSDVRVCEMDAEDVERGLRAESFDNWNEKCDVRRFDAFSINETDLLIEQIMQGFGDSSSTLRTKLNAIKFCEEYENKIIDFTFGDQNSSGTIRFGMIAITRKGDTLDAVSCLYKLEYSIAPKLMSKTITLCFHGVELDSFTTIWAQKKCLGYITQSRLMNFCRRKALEEFKQQNLVSKIKYVTSLT
ncbi:uncharacterized protein LOC128223096 isoform X1 [Mya arenaria]|uniref:uncharacterized protein LOC128223096 isoform X1 n=1 Tax=Mya arenaria TaxID=6604 RepID=UPI0022E0E1C6|nr:uncharacterized protein LOC128223096 isoform X1 [Mya arenaria]